MINQIVWTTMSVYYVYITAAFYFTLSSLKQPWIHSQVIKLVCAGYLPTNSYNKNPEGLWLLRNVTWPLIHNCFCVWSLFAFRLWWSLTESRLCSHFTRTMKECMYICGRMCLDSLPKWGKCTKAISISNYAIFVHNVFRFFVYFAFVHY